MFVELHMLQNFAPSCLNRDDTNAPKDCIFGGYRRARISSQCLKRSIRLSEAFATTVGVNPSVRTKLFADELRKRFEAKGKPPELASQIASALAQNIVGSLETDSRSKVLAFMGHDEIGQAESMALARWDELMAAATLSHSKAKTKEESRKKKEEKTPLQKLAEQLVKEIEPSTNSPDIALFGRMMAENQRLEVEGACQIAHAISTNKVSMEMDFYTAVDDLQPKEEAGAGMMGTVGFNSACFYRYSAIDLRTLVKNLGNDKALASRTVKGFVRASVDAIPSGKQHSMAAHNPPDVILVIVRKTGQPLSLANAFARPVVIDQAKNGGLVEGSLRKLDDHLCETIRVYGKNGIDMMGYTSLVPDALIRSSQIGVKPYVSLDSLIEGMERSVDACIAAAP